MFAETHTSNQRGNCLRPRLNVDPESVGAIHGMSGTGSYLPCPAWCLMSHSDTDRSRRVEAGMVGRVQLSGRVSVTTSHGPASEGAGASTVRVWSGEWIGQHPDDVKQFS